MKLLGEKEERTLFKTILFDNIDEKIQVSNQMELDGWEDLQRGKGPLRVVFKKQIK